MACAVGCEPAAPPPVPPTDMPHVYPRSTISDPNVAEAASEFTEWINQQQVNGASVFEKIEVLPPVQSLEPYGNGTYQRELRLPVILTTGPAWDTLSDEHREEVAAAMFTELSGRLEASGTESPLRPTVTIQTPQGLELAWINNVTPGRRLLHGDGE
jgi:hypothetical protein